MPQNAITTLINALAEAPSSKTLFNPFRDQELASNLRQYLHFLALNPVRLALIGEAAGHRGCALTGMAFTSPETLRVSQNDFFSAHRGTLHRQGDIFEPSGRYVWGVVDAHAIIPLLWNALPLHPHEPGKPRTNRTPTRNELKMGESFLIRVLDIFRPEVVIAVGRKAEQSLNTLFPGLKFTTVRHPSMGGSTLFRSQMTEILRQVPA